MEQNKTLTMIKTSSLFVLIVVVGVSLSVLLYTYLNYESDKDRPPVLISVDGDFEIKQFASDEEFHQYSLEVDSSTTSWSTPGIETLRSMDMMLDASMEMEESISIDRHSTTNVQVQDIDEIDIVKTDGENIYFSNNFWGGYYREPLFDLDFDADFSDSIVPRERWSNVNIVSAFPPEEMEALAELNEEGDLLLYEDTLVGFDYDGIWAYDVADRSDPSKSWDFNYDDRFSLLDARLIDDELILVVNDYGRYNGVPGCPIRPLVSNGVENLIACTDVYYSPVSIDSDTTYVIYKIDVNSGEIKDTISFLGSANNTVLYMSHDNIFLTYSLSGDMMGIMYSFVSENEDLFDSTVVDDIERVKGYDISLDAKMLEFEKIIERFTRTLDDNELLKFETEMYNRQDDFFEKKSRELSFTGIVKIDNSGFEIQATGEVPGSVLNQFSLDEYDKHLRIATTVGENLWSGGESKSVNDLYVLDEELDIVGNALDMGRGERIYSARFIGDRGYIVTFREIDPFYVLNLSDPRNPEIQGELKIPGYSSYLHPISDNMVLGIGMEDFNVKASLFDVSDVFNPQEVSKYILDDSWTEILNNHRAFLLDPKFEIFFVPGSKGGYIFSYKNEKIELVEAISGYNVKRSLFINDYLYLIAQEGITVLDQNTWEVVQEFEF